MPNRKTVYVGSQDVDISLQNSIALIGSSMYSGQAALYVLAGNYNGVGMLKEILKNNGSSFNISITHKGNFVDTIHVTINNGYTWFVTYL